jgi:hypothetical protein
MDPAATVLSCPVHLSKIIPHHTVPSALCYAAMKLHGACCMCDVSTALPFMHTSCPGTPAGCHAPRLFWSTCNAACPQGPRSAAAWRPRWRSTGLYQDHLARCYALLCTLGTPTWVHFGYSVLQSHTMGGAVDKEAQHHFTRTDSTSIQPVVTRASFAKGWR